MPGRRFLPLVLAGASALVTCALPACNRSLEIGKASNLVPIDALAPPDVPVVIDAPADAAILPEVPGEVLPPEDTQGNSDVSETAPGMILWSANAESGDLTEWDGLTHWFLREFDRRGDLKGSSPLKKWASVARHCLSQSQSHRKDL